MANQRDPAWLDHIERFAVKSLIKLVLAVAALLFFGLLVSTLPGINRLGAMLQIPFLTLIRTAVTAILLVLLYNIASQASTIIREIETDAPEFRDFVAAVGFWNVILLAIVVAYEGFRPAGLSLLARAGFQVFYPILFVVMAIIPLAILLVETGVYLHARRRRAMDDEIVLREFQTDEEQVYQLLEASEGRVYQGDVSTVTGWSEGKTSRVLSEMEENGSITRYQIGRQKIVFLPGHEPAFLTSDERGSAGR